MLKETKTPSSISCVQLCAHAAPFWEPQTQFTVKHKPLTPTALLCNTPLANYIAGGLLVPLKWSLCRPLEWLQLKLKAIGYRDGKKHKVLKWRPKGRSRIIFQNRGADGALRTYLCVLVFCPLLSNILTFTLDFIVKWFIYLQVSQVVSFTDGNRVL